MKKISFLFSVIFLYADNLSSYFFTIKENYKEHYNGYLIDRDYNSFLDLKGIGIKYVQNFNNLKIYYITEAAYGNSIYDGAYQDGTPIKVKQNDVQLYNLKIGLNIKEYIFEIGYRFWNRGNSYTIGDYDEQYYWYYIVSGLNYKINFNSFSIESMVKYNYAFSPKLKVYLGNNPTLHLGTTTGLEAQLEINKKINYSYSIGIFYRVTSWHIEESKPEIITIDNEEYEIFEPESYTLNQYIGISIQKSF